jgi:murein peptide amidase A
VPDGGPSPVETRELLDAVLALGFPALGLSRQGVPIVGQGFPLSPVLSPVFSPVFSLVPGQILSGTEVPPSSEVSGNPPPADTLGEGGIRSRNLLVVGGIHGDEPSSVAAVLDLVGRLGNSSRGRHHVFVVPALNPDGLLAGRKNAATDVDLNRNFPARNFVREYRPGYDPGPFPLSEPETALLAQIVDEQSIDTVVAVHAPFGCVNFDGPARAWAETVAAACGWPVRENIGYATPGSLGSWLGIDRNLPVLTLELPPGPLGSFRASAASALDCAIVPIKIHC